VELARGLGVQASRAVSAEEFHRELAASLARPGPSLIEAVL
jgi:thiamine pyrophosphate-dependent acetolactate synthase large subunit-like protein